MNTLGDVLTHPVAIGAGLGGASGAGVGFLASKETGVNRAKDSLTGGAMGAGIGALTGGLIGSGLVDEDQLIRISDEGFQTGFRSGNTAALETVVKKPELAIELIGRMSPEVRKAVFRRFDKGWLARMFGG